MAKWSGVVDRLWGVVGVPVDLGHSEKKKKRFLECVFVSAVARSGFDSNGYITPGQLPP